MKARPLTAKSRPGGRPRARRAKPNSFATWLADSERGPKEIADDLGVAVSSIYSMRNGYFSPGRDLAVRIESMTTPRDSRGRATGPSAVPVSSWSAVPKR